MGEAAIGGEMDKRFVVVLTIIVAVAASGCSRVSSSTGPSEEFKKAVMDFPTAASSADTRTSSVETATPEPAAPPEPKAGKIVSAVDYDTAVAGGRYITVRKKRYLALKIYVKSSGADLMWFGTSLAIEDQSGDLIDYDHPALEKTTLMPPLETFDYELQDGESTGAYSGPSRT
jgi:uncharacterized protein YceK